MQHQKKVQEEEQAKKQQTQQAQRQESISPPASPQKGPIGPGGSRGQRAVSKLEQERKNLSAPPGSN